MDNIKKDIEQLFMLIEETNVYKDFLSVKKQMKANEEVMNLIKKIKRYQKIIVNNNDEVIKKELCELFDKLNNYPIYQSYLEILEELNNELTNIKKVFEDYFRFTLKIK